MLSVRDVPVIQEFPDLFLKELLGLSPEREVEFAFEVQLGTDSIWIHRIGWHQQN